MKVVRGSYGANLARALAMLAAKEGRRKIPQEEMARRMKVGRQANLPSRTKKADVPKPSTIQRDATALQVTPGFLLEGVVLQIDIWRGLDAFIAPVTKVAPPDTDRHPRQKNDDREHRPYASKTDGTLNAEAVPDGAPVVLPLTEAKALRGIKKLRGGLGRTGQGPVKSDRQVRAGGHVKSAARKTNSRNR